MLGSTKDRVLGVGTLGQHVPPRVWYGTALSYAGFMPKPSTHRMHDPGSIVPHIQPKSVHT
jgi:hypothetical protein